MEPEHAGELVGRDRRALRRRHCRVRLGGRGRRQGGCRGPRLLPLRLGSPVEEPAEFIVLNTRALASSSSSFMDMNRSLGRQIVKKRFGIIFHGVKKDLANASV